MTFSRAIKGSIVLAALLSMLAQFAIAPTAENMLCACLVFISSVIVILYLTWTDALETNPLSTLAVLGFCLESQWGAMVAQTLAWTPLTFSLYDPVYTFGTLAFYQAIILAVHAMYRRFSAKDRGPGTLRTVLTDIGFYRTPSAGALWIMACIGLPCLYLTNRSSAGAEGALSKLVQPLYFLTWAPFLIPIFRLQLGDAYCSVRQATRFVPLYAGVVALVGVAVSGRALLFIGALTVIMLFLLQGIRSKERITRKFVTKFAVAALVAGILLHPLSNFVVAMGIARAQAGKISQVALINRTITIFNNPYLIAAWKASRAASNFTLAYDERYIASPVLSKFVETKFHDNALHFGGLIVSDSDKQRLRQVTVNALWAVLPTPILDVMGFHINKADLDFSIGDYLVYLSKGGPLGGRRTGSSIAHGLVLFGPVFPFVFVLICWVMISVMELLTIRVERGAAQLSAVGMMNLWTFFTHGFTHDSLSAMFVYVVRGFPEMVFVYWFALGLTGLFLRNKYAASPVKYATG